MRSNYKARQQAERNQKVIEAFLWISMLTLNRKDKYGKDRLERYRESFVSSIANYDRECAKFGEDVALFHLRERIRQIMGEQYFKETKT